MTISRTLNVQVTFNCIPRGDRDFGGTASYLQTGSTPDMGAIVDSGGTIRLDAAPAYDGAVYNENVDIHFTLQSTSTGTVTPVIWARTNGPGMHITVPDGGSASEFNVITYAQDPNLILVQDNDDDSNTYNYKPAVELTAHDNYYISVDPQIVNRPGTSN